MVNILSRHPILSSISGSALEISSAVHWYSLPVNNTMRAALVSNRKVSIETVIYPFACNNEGNLATYSVQAMRDEYSDCNLSLAIAVTDAVSAPIIARG